MRLSKDDIALLRMLDKENDAAAADSAGLADQPKDAPKSLFEFNLVNRHVNGELQLTKTGARALFQAECIDALEQTLAGAEPAMTGGVERWLVSSGFLHATDGSVTTRGKLWLASLTPEDAGLQGEPSRHEHCGLNAHHGRHGLDSATAEAFAARRGAA